MLERPAPAGDSALPPRDPVPERRTSDQTAGASTEPASPGDPPPARAATDAEAEPGQVLLAEWRASRAAFRRATVGREPSRLLALLDAILHRPDGAATPLSAAVRAALARAADPAALLRAVLERIVDDVVIDLDDPALAATPSQATEPPRPLPAALWPRVAAILEGRAAAAAEPVATAASEDPGRLAALLAAADDPPGRLGRFVASSTPPTRRRLLDQLRPGFASRELVALELIWSELPADMAAADPRGEAMWRFALTCALGRLPPTGGIAGLTAQAVAALATGRRTEPELARHLLGRLEGARPQRSPAAAAQVVAGLRALAGVAAAPVPAEALVFTRTAGLVLVAAYLPTLFERLALADRTGLLGPEAAARATDVLHAVVHGADDGRHDTRPLERLLCGIPDGEPLRPPLPLEPGQAAVVDDLLRTVIARWAALGSTTVAGLREAFLQREGLLRRVEAGHTLEVTPKSYDMLLDRLPWSFALIKLAWMPAPLQVTWRK